MTPPTATALREGAEAIADAQPMIHAELASALVAALAELEVVTAERTAKVEMKTGGSYSYKYADIADAVKTTRPVLANHGLVALTPVHGHGSDLACTVIIVHTSGQRLDLGPFPFPHGRDAQATGSMVTYHRRYALIAALGMAAGDDDDGAAARPRSAPAGPSPELAAMRLALADLPEDVAERLTKDALARSGAVDLADVVADEGWRKWLNQAIEHHKSQENT